MTTRSNHAQRQEWPSYPLHHDMRWWPWNDTSISPQFSKKELNSSIAERGWRLPPILSLSYPNHIKFSSNMSHFSMLHLFSIHKWNESRVLLRFYQPIKSWLDINIQNPLRLAKTPKSYTNFFITAKMQKIHDPRQVQDKVSAYKRFQYYHH